MGRSALVVGMIGFVLGLASVAPGALDRLPSQPNSIPFPPLRRGGKGISESSAAKSPLSVSPQGRTLRASSNWRHTSHPPPRGAPRLRRPKPPPIPSPPRRTRELRSFDRFLSLLEKNPRRGTALDRVYGYHVERGTLDAFIKSYRDRLAKNPKDGTAWLILGLLEGQRGQDAAAVTALRQAETTRPDDPLPSYYLGQALVLVGQPEQAADAFERGSRTQAGAERPAGDLPGTGTRLSAHPEKRPGPPGLEPARSPVPRRPPRPGADRLRTGRGEPAGPGPAAVRGARQEGHRSRSARSSSPCRPPI